MPDEITPPVYPYEVTISDVIYTVIAPEGEPGYRVRLATGQVTAYPAHSGDPSETNAAADISHAIANPPAPAPAVARQSTRTVISRLTDAESEALFGSDQWQIKAFVAMATAEGAIRSDDPAFVAGVPALNVLNIIATARWELLLAP